MIILEDTRQKPQQNSHIREQLTALGYEVKRCRLFVGDYTFPTDQSVCVDTKQDLQEVVGNVTKQHERFANECKRAKAAGIKLVILVQDPKITELSGVFGWYNPRLRFSKVATTGRTLAKIMYSMRDKYGVQWEFATKDKIGERIIELLEEGNNEV